MAAINNHQSGNKVDASVEVNHAIAEDFDYTEEVESGFTESEFVNLDADTEELDIPNFVGDLRALMVDDSEDEVVLDSDDDGKFKDQKEGKIRGRLWRRASAVGAQSSEVWSSAGSNLTDKKSDNGLHAETHYQEAQIARSRERNLISYNKNVPMVDPDQYSNKYNNVEGDEFVISKAPCNKFENENGAYDESQEPGESSQANALEFVDRYLSVSVVNSSPEATIPKALGLRSPLASCVKGSKDLAVKTDLMSKIGISTFEWDDNQPDHGGELFLTKKKELDIQREKRLDERCEDRVQELAVVNPERTYRVNEFDEQLQEELLKRPFENDGGNERDLVNMFDVGFDTQMAAEAMEALLYAPPPTGDANELEGLEKKTSKERDSQTDGISCKQKVVTHISHQISHKDYINQKDSNVELPSTIKARGESSTQNVKKLHNRSLKVFCRKKQKKHSDKEVETFSPVACRTRLGSSVNRSQRTEDTCNPRDKLENDFKRKLGYLDTGFLLEKLKEAKKGEALFGDSWKWPKKRRTCRNVRHNETFKSTLNTLSPVVGVGSGNSVVGPSETEGNFREAFCMSNVKRRARSASRHRSTDGNKLLKDRSTRKAGQPCLADVTNTKCASMNFVPALADEKKMNDSSPTGKKLIKKNTTSPFLRNELTRLGFAESFPDFTSTDLRRRRRKAEIRVLFSQNLDVDVVKQLRKMMTKLGTSMAKHCSDATHFVADRFARTKKMLEAMAFGKPVVTPLWLESCEQAGYVIDEKNYILRDAKREKELGFSMPVSLSRARAHPLLKDQQVLITPNIKPDRETIRSLVKAVHGQVIDSIQEANMEYKISDKLLILSCEQDYDACVPFLDKGAAAYSSELLLNGIIIQKLEYARHQLFHDHVIMKRYARQRRKNRSQCPHVG